MGPSDPKSPEELAANRRFEMFECRAYVECDEDYGCKLEPCPSREPKKKGQVEFGLNFGDRDDVAHSVGRNPADRLSAELRPSDEWTSPQADVFGLPERSTTRKW